MSRTYSLWLQPKVLSIKNMQFSEPISTVQPSMHVQDIVTDRKGFTYIYVQKLPHHVLFYSILLQLYSNLILNIKQRTMFYGRSYSGGTHPKKIQHGLLHISTKFHAIITK